MGAHCARCRPRPGEPGGRASLHPLSTHDPDQAFLCADRAALLHAGRLTRLGPPDEVITTATLQATYGVDVEVTEFAHGDGRRVRVCVPRLGAAGRPMA